MTTDSPAAGASALEIRRTFDAPRERVFAALTQPEILRQWFCPTDMTVTEVEFVARVGEPFVVKMREPDGSIDTGRGVVREVAPPERLSYTWQWSWDNGEDPSPETLITIELRERDGKTDMTFRHEGFLTEKSRDGHEHGWNQVFDKLPPLL